MGLRVPTNERCGAQRATDRLRVPACPHTGPPLRSAWQGRATLGSKVSPAAFQLCDPADTASVCARLRFCVCERHHHPSPVSRWFSA